MYQGRGAGAEGHGALVALPALGAVQDVLVLRESGLDCLICGLDCLICGLDCLICTMTVVYVQ